MLKTDNKTIEINEEGLERYHAKLKI